MKLSISLPDEDVAFLDRYATSVGATSRSAVVRRALRMLRNAELGRAYEEAWSEWDDSGEASVWEVTVGDGADG